MSVGQSNSGKFMYAWHAHSRKETAQMASLVEIREVGRLGGNAAGCVRRRRRSRQLERCQRRFRCACNDVLVSGCRSGRHVYIFPVSENVARMLLSIAAPHKTKEPILQRALQPLSIDLR